jgi:hypothetical protein
LLIAIPRNQRIDSLSHTVHGQSGGVIGTGLSGNATDVNSRHDDSEQGYQVRV